MANFPDGYPVLVHDFLLDLIKEVLFEARDWGYRDYDDGDLYATAGERTYRIVMRVEDVTSNGN